MSRTSRNAVVSLSGSLLAMLLGMAVVVCVGARLGAGPGMDAFWTANTLPNVLGQIYLSISLLLLSPAFVQRRTQVGDAEAWMVGNSFLTGAVAVALLLTALLYVGAPWLIRVLAPGFGAESGGFAVELLRILSMSLLGLAVAGVGTTILVSHHRFGVASLLRPVTYMCVLVGVLAFSAKHGIRAYAYATVAGSLVSLTVVVGALRPYWKSIRPAWRWRDPATLSLLSMLPMILLARAVDHGNQIVTRAIGSTLPAGSISALAYAWAIFQVPGILGSSIGTVLFPQFSEKFAAGRTEELVGQVVRCFRIMFLVSAPLAVGLCFLSVPLVQVLFERGLFRHSDSILTGRVLAFYGFGVLVTSVNGLIGNLYWSLRRVGIRVGLEAVAIAFGLVLALALSPVLGAPGLALSTSCMYLVLTAAGVTLLQRHLLPSESWRRLLQGVIRTVSCAVGAGLLLGAWVKIADSIKFGPTGVLVCGGFMGGIAYVVFAWAIQREDLLALVASLRSALRGGDRPMDPSVRSPLAVAEGGASGVGR